MSATQHGPGRTDRDFLESFHRWSAAPGPWVNIYRDAIPCDELALKRKRFRKVIEAAGRQAQEPLDASLDWDVLIKPTTRKMTDAALFYLFTGDRRAIGWADDALQVMAACERPHFCYSTLIGMVDIDLRTAAVIRSLAIMRSCFGDALPPALHRRLQRLALDRCLQPGLEAFRHETYWWTTCKMNWRSVLAGSFAMGAMAFADCFEPWHEMITYGIEGILAVLDEGDRDGGWQEGPSYWEYGLLHCVEPAFALRGFTGGAVDLFKHAYLRRTGAFRVYMSTSGPGHLWGWSDSHKKAENSPTLTILARRYRNPMYQAFCCGKPITSLVQLFHLDPSLSPDGPGDASAWPLAKCFRDIGLCVMRTGFGKSDTFIGVKAGGLGEGVNHEHADLGSLVIVADGQELLAELENWPYAQGEGKCGGFFDRPGRRWDYDGNTLVGHNLVMVEGRYPPFERTARASIRHVRCEPDGDLVTVDASVMHQPLAERVKRHVLFLRPSAVLVIDVIRAGARIRARSLFHYLGRATVGPDTFSIIKGGVVLEGTSLYPAVRDNVIMGRDERIITYHTEHGPMQRCNRYVYVENLHRTEHPVFITLLTFGRPPLKPVTATLEGDPAMDRSVTVCCRDGEQGWTVTCDLASGSVTLPAPRVAALKQKKGD